MRIKQKKGHIEVEYDFQDEALHYRTADRSGVRDVMIPYEAITLDDVTTVHARRFSRSAPPDLVALLAVLAMLAVRWSADQDAVTAFFAAFFAVLTIALRRLRGPQLTVFNTHRGKIRVIVDGKDHDMIVSEMKARWLRRMKALYGAIDFSADPGKEIAKFKWLRERSIVTEPEYQEAVRKLQAVHSRTAADDIMIMGEMNAVH